jgi:integrase/recombinase XerC
MLKIRVLKTKKGLPSFVKEGEMVKLLDSLTFENTFDGWRDKIILELFYSTGIRLSELIHLKDRQVDIKGTTIKVLGKRNKERIIPFPSSLVTIIETYRCFRDKEIPMNKCELLLVTEKGEPCYPVMIYRIVKNYLNLYTTTDKRSPHVLRHSYATHLLNKGAEINAVKDLLGHSSLAATQVYTHNSIEKLKKAFDKAHPKA